MAQQRTRGLRSRPRRDFLRASGALSGGFILEISLSGASFAAPARGIPATINAWIRIGSDNSITFVCARSESGQGVYTSLSMLIAEELEVDVNAVKVEFAPVAPVYGNALLGAQMTGASTSVREAWDKLRTAGAAARMMLVAAAAQSWNVDVAQCRTANGSVFGPGKKKATYGQLAAAAARMPVPENIALKPASSFKTIGNPKQKRLDTPAKVKGQAQFGIDVQVPGMLYAAVAMAPAIGARVASFDDARARAVPGVKAIVQYGRGIAVVADSWWQAKGACALLKVRWDEGPLATADQKSIWEGLRNAIEQPGRVFREIGDVDAAMAQAVKTVDATYRLPFLAHAGMEPLNAVADVRRNRAIIYAPTQFQQLVPHVVAAVTGLKPSQVELQTTFIGGGSARRIEVDYIVDAAEISKAVGAPVKMIWSREDDMTHDAYVPAGVVGLSAGVDPTGKALALRFNATSPPIPREVYPDIAGDAATNHIDNFAYAIPALKIAFQAHDTGVTAGGWRGASHNLNAVALECFIDELAAAAEKDAIFYRIDMLEAGGERTLSLRMKHALEEARLRSGWGKPLQGGRGMGVAIAASSNTVVAVVAQAMVSPDYAVTIEKVTAVVDAGILVHPDQAMAQVQGAIVQGQSACMWGEISIRNGAVEQTNFDTYRVARMHQAPKLIDVQFIRSDSAPGGLRVPVVAAIQPAIGNAIFAACGKRCRTLPYTPENIKGYI
ncbi:MAG TPA: molybdopterin cofactor-binding domain-containing protein [Burkholderiales bacterium]|nr:molybdopterin cofactor-binding domain-containing protein [Burkholderiales bacterium]